MRLRDVVEQLCALRVMSSLYLNELHETSLLVNSLPSPKWTWQANISSALLAEFLVSTGIRLNVFYGVDL